MNAVVKKLKIIVEWTRRKKAGLTFGSARGRRIVKVDLILSTHPQTSFSHTLESNYDTNIQKVNIKMQTALFVCAVLIPWQLLTAASPAKRVVYSTRKGSPSNLHYISRIETTSTATVTEKVGTNCGDGSTKGQKENLTYESDCTNKTVKTGEIIKVPERTVECAGTDKVGLNGLCRRNWG